MMPEELYVSLRSTVERVNAIVATFVEEDSPMGDLTVRNLKKKEAFCEIIYEFFFMHNKYINNTAVYYIWLFSENYWENLNSERASIFLQLRFTGPLIMLTWVYNGTKLNRIEWNLVFILF